MFIGAVEELVTNVTYNAATKQLTMTCNLVNSKKLLEFCTFMRQLDDLGMNLEQGRGNDKYR